MKLTYLCKQYFVPPTGQKVGGSKKKFSARSARTICPPHFQNRGAAPGQDRQADVKALPHLRLLLIYTNTQGKNINQYRLNTCLKVETLQKL